MNRKLAIAAGAALSLIIGYKAYTYLVIYTLNYRQKRMSQLRLHVHNLF